MQEKLKRGNTALAVKAGFWYVASIVLIRGILFITTPIFSRLMSDTAYGEFSNFASWQGTLLIITSAGLYNTLGRAYYDYTKDYDQYVSSITITSFGLTGIIYLLFLVCRSWIFNIVSIPEQYVHILFFLLTFQSCKLIYMSRERTLYRYKSVAAISTIDLIIPTAIALLAVVILPDSQKLSARIYGHYLPSALIGMFCMIILLLRGKSFRIEHCKYAFKLSLPLLINYLTAYLLTSSNTIITKSVLGAQATAIVSIASSTIHIFTVLFQSLSGALTTWLMDNLQQRKEEKIKHELLIYVGLLSAVAIAVILVAPEVVWILGGSKYARSAPLIPGLVVAVFIQSVTSLFAIILTYDKNVIKTAVYTSIVTALSIAAKTLLLQIYSYQVLPFIDIAAFGVLFIINYVLVKKAGYGSAINIKDIVCVILAVCLVMGCSYFLYEHTFIRYAVVAVFGAIAVIAIYKKRKLLIPLIKSRSKKKTTVF